MIERVSVSDRDFTITRTVLGPWAIGGWQGGETNDDAAIWGARKPSQVTFSEVFGWELSAAQVREIEKIVEDTVEEPISPAFMAPEE